MNFFEAQATARRNTLVLIVLFCIAVAGLVALANVLVMALISYQQTGMMLSSWQDLVAAYDVKLFGIIAVGVSLVILLGSLYKVSLLSSGGRAVAESLGGRLIPSGSTDPVHRKILNVVEEMAIASGSPVPSVYLLDESGINAFAAGWSSSNAVIGITRGAIIYLSRDELQGVIAHEFSHIFNGDMRLNIRLIGILHGILLLGIIGYYLMRSVRYIGSSRNREGGSAVAAIFVLGVGLTVIGYVGTFIGQWIKAIVSRQREYLADASAVQFTRNREGISGALKKIGGLQIGSKLLTPSAPEYSHAYFAAGLRSFIGRVFATHPPLKTRIRRLEPRWSGEFVVPHRDESLPKEQQAHTDDQGLANAAKAAAVGAVVSEALQAIDNIGQPGEKEINYARRMLNELPQALRVETENAFGARALIYCLILHNDTDLQPKQLQILQQQADPAVYEKTQQLFPLVSGNNPRYRLPLIELCFPALRELSRPQYRRFKDNLLALMKSDQKIDLGEWIIQRLLLQQLDEAQGLRRPPVAKFTHIGAIKREAELLLSLVAYTEHKGDDVAAAAAFKAGITAVGATALTIVPRTSLALKEIDAAMNRLEQVKPLIKPRLLKAVVACINVDGKVTPRGEELLRTLSSCLDSPIPPINR